MTANSDNTKHLITRRNLLLASGGVALAPFLSTQVAEAAGPQMLVVATMKGAYSTLDVGETIVFPMPGTGNLAVGVSSMGETNAVQILDAKTGALLTTTQLPDVGSGTKRLAFSPNAKVLIAAQGANLWTINPSTGAIVDTFTASDGAQVIYSPYVAGDGALWVGTYPDASLRKLTLSDDGKITANAKVFTAGGGAQYLRYITSRGNTIACATGVNGAQLVLFDTTTGTATRIDTKQAPQGLYGVSYVSDRYLAVTYADKSNNVLMDSFDVTTGKFTVIPNASGYHKLMAAVPETNTLWVAKVNALLRVDVSTSKVVESHSFTGNVVHSLAVTIDQGKPMLQIVMTDTKTTALRYARNDATAWKRSAQADLKMVPSSARIQSVTSTADDRTVVGGYQGDGVRIVDVAKATVFNPNGASGEQIESAVSLNGALFAGSYNSAQIFKIDSSNNSKRIAILRDTYGQSRPRAMVALADNTIVIGTVADAGKQGGGVIRIDSNGKVLGAYLNPVGSQSITGLATDGTKTVYGGSALLGGYGAPVPAGDAHVFKMDATIGTVAWSTALPSVKVANAPTLLNGILYVASRSKVYAIDVNNGTITKTINVSSSVETERYASAFMAPVSATKLLHHSAGRLTVVDVSTGTCNVIGTGPYDLLAKRTKTNTYLITSDNRDIIEFQITGI